MDFEHIIIQARKLSTQVNVIKIRPPLCFSEADADFVVAALDGILSEDPVRYD